MLVPLSDVQSELTARWMGYKLFPYERRLGLRELNALGLTVMDDGDEFVTLAGDPTKAIERSTYFETVAHSSHGCVLTDQAAVEMTHLELRDDQRPRQATRYGLHGIHEYKGKFNPQVVRALCNIVDADAKVLIDPFSGSGTALVEGLRLRMDVVGIDHSPIACFIADAKLRAMLAASRAAVVEELLGLRDRCADAIEKGQGSASSSATIPTLSAAANKYLQHWFTPPAHTALAGALDILHRVPDSPARRLALAALSSILRHVSLQLPEDLRIRRRSEPFTAPPIAPLFRASVDAIRRGLAEMEPWPDFANHGSVVMHGSAEHAQAYEAARGPRRRLILTSPPYATALPYIDTDRLSVVALGLADSVDLLPLERSLIGSREWTRGEQVEWDGRRRANAEDLPMAIQRLVTDIDDRNRRSTAGFRRKAVPSLLYRYFARMGRAMTAWHNVLAPGEYAVLIVGHNHTTAGGERIDIPTPDLLGHIAESRGFDVAEILTLETWPRYGLHAANGVPGEDALVIRRRD
jgi:hypothetical protein